jgi:CCR4-NOT transcription complex subunit 2
MPGLGMNAAMGKRRYIDNDLHHPIQQQQLQHLQQQQQHIQRGPGGNVHMSMNRDNISSNNAYSNTTNTLPSNAMMDQNIYNTSAGLSNNFPPLPSSMSQQQQQSGYSNAHLSGNNLNNDNRQIRNEYNDDFPSLYSSGSSNALGTSTSSSSSSGPNPAYFIQNQQQQYSSQQQALQQQRALQQQQQQQGQINMPASSRQIDPLSGAGSLPLNMRSNIPSTSAVALPGGISNEQNYGLSLLMSSMKTDNADLISLVSGVDLNSLGLNYNSSEPLFTMFSSPWMDSGSILREPIFHLPQCYPRAVPANSEAVSAFKAGKFSEYKLETLFYTFYAMPQDAMQILSARELYSRGWMYHTETKIWFNNNSNNNSQKQQQEERQVIYFDINRWESRVYAGNPITSDFMPIDEITAATNDVIRNFEKGRGDIVIQSSQLQPAPGLPSTTLGSAPMSSSASHQQGKSNGPGSTYGSHR